MTTIDASRAEPQADGEKGTLPALLAVVAIAALTLLVQSWNPGVTDVSWLIVVAERVLDGQRLYVDVLEANPPASLLLYLPFVALARLMDLSAETVVMFAMTGGTAVSILAAGRILRRAGLLPRPLAHAIAASIACMLLAGNCFAQREHVAVVALLPLLALTAARMSGAVVSLAGALAVGVAAGCVISIKPQFGGAIALPLLVAALGGGGWRVFFRPECFAAGCVFAAYVAATFLWYPEFWSFMYPLVAEVYRPARLDAITILYLVVQPLLYTAAYVGVSRIDKSNPVVTLPVAAAAGFLLAYFEQSKGWAYHFYPTLALLALVVVSDLPSAAARRLSTSARVAGLLAALLLVAWSIPIYLPDEQITRKFEPAVARVIQNPRVFALSGDLALAHPFTRRLHGTFVGTVACQWISQNARRVLRGYVAPEHRKSLGRWIDWDRGLAAADVARADPDVIILDKRDAAGSGSKPSDGNWADWRDWATPELRAALKRYAVLGSDDAVDILVRRDLLD